LFSTEEDTTFLSALFFSEASLLLSKHIGIWHNINFIYKYSFVPQIIACFYKA